MNKKIRNIVLIILAIVILLFGYLIISDNQKITGESIFSKFTKKTSKNQIQNSGNSGGASAPRQLTYWNVTYDGGYNDHAKGIALDDNGNVYVTGDSEISNGDGDYYTIKYDSDGNEIWNVSYDGGYKDIARGIALDNNGSVYITGGSQTSDGNRDYYTIKYDSDGNEIWANRHYNQYNGSHSDLSESIIIDDYGNMYITGSARNSNGSILDYYTIKYDSYGNEIWNIYFEGGFYDYAKDIAVDSDGNVYITGGSENSSSGYLDYYTIKYNSSGEEIWGVRYDGGYNDVAYGIALGENDTVYVTGYSVNYNPTHNIDYYTIKYDSDGNEIWNVRFEEGSFPQDIVVDSDENIYIAGGTGEANYHVIKYDSDGNEIWRNKYSSENSSYAYGIDIDSNGDLYLTGFSGSNQSWNYWTLKTPNIGCGDNIAEGDEECDGTDLNGETCVSLGHAGGNLTCRNSCVFNEIQCYEKTGWGWGWFTR